MNKRLVILLLASVLHISSCTPGQSLEPTLTPAPTQVLTPTVTPTKTITPSPTLTTEPTFTPEPTFYTLDQVCYAPVNAPVIINGYFYLPAFEHETEGRYLIGLLDQPRKPDSSGITNNQVSLSIKVGTSPNEMRQLPSQYGLGDFKIFTDTGNDIGYGHQVTISGVNLGAQQDGAGCIILVEKVAAGFYNEFDKSLQINLHFGSKPEQGPGIYLLGTVKNQTTHELYMNESVHTPLVDVRCYGNFNANYIPSEGEDYTNTIRSSENLDFYCVLPNLVGADVTTIESACFTFYFNNWNEHVEICEDITP